MSTTSRVVLAVSVVVTLSTVAGVHAKQTWDRQVGKEEEDEYMTDITVITVA